MTETLSPALPNDIEALIEAVLKGAESRDVTLATAESCTGGLIASVLTDVEGRSHVFERGYVVYTDDAKADELAVPPRLIARNGAVSEPVARAMAEGALRASGAGAAVAVTGFAGQAGPDDEPGLVHFAVAASGAPTVHEEHHFGDIGRGPCRLECLRVALRMLEAAVINR
ncbi:CinA family protein [Brevundimonas sp.]|uniref:CinA family protein n=1 Tax=Brevundimonas sp. TaxID=1871086 RepID=UPI002737A1A4|nr:nicotinamide-nucleotide amidohydrolase family protein [Brevundimonas sp.]MDP3803088.1 nicotinamide-nucleotide amidohydrolase family protein [Brevundimonas sp.]